MFHFCDYVCICYAAFECLQFVLRHVMFGHSEADMVNFLATFKATQLTAGPADSHGNLII